MGVLSFFSFSPSLVHADSVGKKETAAKKGGKGKRKRRLLCDSCCSSFLLFRVGERKRETEDEKVFLSLFQWASVCVAAKPSHPDFSRFRSLVHLYTTNERGRRGFKTA